MFILHWYQEDPTNLSNIWSALPCLIQKKWKLISFNFFVSSIILSKIQLRQIQVIFG